MDKTQHQHLTQNDLKTASHDYCDDDRRMRSVSPCESPEDKTDPDIDVLRLSPDHEEEQESAAERVRRELASNQTPSDKDTLSELSRLVGNIKGEATSPPPLVKPTPLIPDVRAMPSPSQPLPVNTPYTPSFQRQLRVLAEHHRAALLSPRGAHPPLLGHAGLMSPSVRWMPTWPSPPMHHPSMFKIPSFQGLSPWSCSPSSAPVPPNMHAMLPPFAPFMPFPPIPIPKVTTSTPNRELDLSPLDLSGSSKAKSSPADSSSSDLASPLKDISPSQPSPKRARTEAHVDGHRNSAENPQDKLLNPSLVNSNTVDMNKMKNTPDKCFLPRSPFLGSLPHPLTSPFRTPISMPFYHQKSPTLHRHALDSEADIHLNRRRRFLSPESVRILTDWYKEHEEHPYPSDQVVEALARLAGISVFQVKKWMANKRVRSCNTLAFNGSIHPKKLQKLIQLKENSESSPNDEEITSDTKRTPKTPRGSRFLDPSAVDHMNKWYNDHLAYPYPTEDEKNAIAKDAGLTVAQVTCWFANKRNRNNNTKKISSKNLWQRVNRRVEFTESPDRPPLGHYPVHPGFHPTHLMPPLGLLPTKGMADSN